MTGGPLWGEALLALFLGAVVLWFVRWSLRSDKRLGRQAYRDGLPYNPKWGASICEGWREARAEDEKRKLG